MTMRTLIAESDQLKILSCELQAQENAHEHRTERYACVIDPPYHLVCRRGQPVEILLYTSRRYEPRCDKLTLVLENEAALCRKEIVVWDDFGSIDGKTYAAKIGSFDDDRIAVKVAFSIDSPVGEWKIAAIVDSGVEKAKLFKLRNSIFVIFNPWHPGDATSFPQHDHLNEYVLNAYGCIVLGTSHQPTPIPWSYAQYEDCCFYGVLLLLDILVSNGILSRGDLNDPVQIARALTFGIHQYVIEGKWPTSGASNSYFGGRAPHEWMSSEEIFEIFYLENNRKVKFAQCFVFAGIFTTVCRTLGIPCRVVTNFGSGHGTNKDLTVECGFRRDALSSGYRKVSDESIWNFHVWNEAWMKRTDLASKYSGWQICDSTPQHSKEVPQLVQCGPFPVRAILEGDLAIPYDGWFIYGEVNSDFVEVKYGSDKIKENEVKPRCLESKETFTGWTGRCIFTTDVYNCARCIEITNAYKEEEGTEAERNQHSNALKSLGLSSAERRRTPRSAPLKADRAQDLFIWFSDILEAALDKPLECYIEIKNTSNEPRTAVVNFQGDVVLYTGASIYNFCDTEQEVFVEPKSSIECGITILPEAFATKLGDDWQIAVDVVATVKETNQIFHAKDSIEIQRPNLSVHMRPVISVGAEEAVEVTLRNPFNDSELTGCELRLYGSGFRFSNNIFVPRKTILPGETFKATADVVPRRSGQMEIIALFNCDQIKNIRGYIPTKTR